MSKERYVSYEIAKLLKEKGFDWGCNCWVAEYDTGVELHADMERRNYNDDNVSLYDGLFSAPTQQMTCDWMEETHGLFIKIGRSMDINSNYYYSYNVLDKDNISQIKSIRPNKEEAIGAALLYCLTNLI